MLYAPVQTDKTAESAAEMLRESKDVIGAKPLTGEEIEKIKVGDVRSMPGDYQTRRRRARRDATASSSTIDPTTTCRR